MFGYNYKMQTVNEDKGIVRLTPTLGTYAKAVLPGLVISAMGSVVLFALSLEDRRIDFTATDPEDIPNSED